VVILKIFERLIPLVAQFFGIWVAMLAFWLIFVKVSRVRWPSKMGNNGAIDFTVVQAVPVDILEPRVGFDTASTAANVAQSLGCIDSAEAGNEVACINGHCAGEANFALYNPVKVLVHARTNKCWGGRFSVLFVDLHGVLVPEGWLAD
jgi:hypothetical protein